MHALQPSHTWRYELLTHAAHTLLFFHSSTRGGFSWSRMPGTLPSSVFRISESLSSKNTVQGTPRPRARERARGETRARVFACLTTHTL
eukprot:scaffold13287_cov60-Phaeocystis_antarctica.AAC.3